MILLYCIKVILILILILTKYIIIIGRFLHYLLCLESIFTAQTLYITYFLPENKLSIQYDKKVTIFK